jgi:predicted flap endonuclease-1-like 5' DNA nuclease
MSYLITQTFILLLIAGLLGLALGWYLTRIAAAASGASLERRLRAAENDARGLRAELDAAVAAGSACENERKSLAEDLATLRAGQEALRVGANGSDGAAVETPLHAVAQAASDPGPVDDTPDDLQRIKGIGPKIAAILDELGVRRFEQIAAWTPDNVDQINAQLRFRGRIEREAWIPQAKALLAERGGAE